MGPRAPLVLIVTSFDLDDHIDEVPGCRRSGEFVVCLFHTPMQLVAAVLAEAAGGAR